MNVAVGARRRRRRDRRLCGVVVLAFAVAVMLRAGLEYRLPDDVLVALRSPARLSLPLRDLRISRVSFHAAAARIDSASRPKIIVYL